VQLANHLDELHALGADVVALTVDPPGRNAALAQRWHLPFPIHSDPGGERWMQPLDLWNPAERGGIGWPAVLVFDRDGVERARFRSRDFADRPPTLDDLTEALASLDADPIAAPSPWTHPAPPEDDPAALRPDAFGPYFRGIRFATIGLSGRLTDDADRAEALRMSAMAAMFLDEWKARRERTGA
jgi:AhpC/TSA family